MCSHRIVRVSEDYYVIIVIVLEVTHRFTLSFPLRFLFSPFVLHGIIILETSHPACGEGGPNKLLGASFWRGNNRDVIVLQRAVRSNVFFVYIDELFRLHRGRNGNSVERLIKRMAVFTSGGLLPIMTFGIVSQGSGLSFHAIDRLS